jgi:hypothetical protein
MEPPIELKFWLDDPNSDQAIQECKRVRDPKLDIICGSQYFMHLKEISSPKQTSFEIFNF